ncbi:MAG: response regulator transcription factor [Mangrovibacterium sp.]
MDKCRINIALVEPSQIICEGLTTILLKAESHNRIFRFDSLDEMISAIPTHRINLALINPALAKDNIPDFIQKRNSAQLNAWIGILYTLHDRDVLTLFDATIHITDSSEQIAETIHQLSVNKCHCSNCHRSESLTSREIDILRQITLGLSNKEIADKLNISVHTVVSHRKNIICKTGIKSQAGLTIYAISNKIISLENFAG